GGDLLTLINEILDLSKVEAGKMQVEPRDVPLTDVQGFAERDFRPLADEKQLEFVTEIDPRVGNSIRTDPQRLQQVLKNLLANALKFTDAGWVKLRIGPADKRRVQFAHTRLLESPAVVAFAVTDTGI